jgi:hypothetical protein
MARSLAVSADDAFAPRDQEGRPTLREARGDVKAGGAARADVEIRGSIRIRVGVPVPRRAALRAT